METRDLFCFFCKAHGFDDEAVYRTHLQKHFETNRFCEKCDGVQGVIDRCDECAATPALDARQVEGIRVWINGFIDNKPRKRNAIVLGCPLCQRLLDLNNSSPKVSSLGEKKTQDAIDHLNSHLVTCYLVCNLCKHEHHAYSTMVSYEHHVREKHKKPPRSITPAMFTDSSIPKLKQFIDLLVANSRSESNDNSYQALALEDTAPAAKAYSLRKRKRESVAVSQPWSSNNYSQEAKEIFDKLGLRYHVIKVLIPRLPSVPKAVVLDIDEVASKRGSSSEQSDICPDVLNSEKRVEPPTVPVKEKFVSELFIADMHVTFLLYIYDDIPF